jgi:hypothetical protein
MLPSGACTFPARSPQNSRGRRGWGRIACMGPTVAELERLPTTLAGFEVRYSRSFRSQRRCLVGEAGASRSFFARGRSPGTRARHQLESASQPAGTQRDSAWKRPLLKLYGRTPQNLTARPAVFRDAAALIKPQLFRWIDLNQQGMAIAAALAQSFCLAAEAHRPLFLSATAEAFRRATGSQSPARHLDRLVPCPPTMVDHQRKR